MKIVVNTCFGGFSISLEAAKFMAARGNKTALDELEDYYLKEHKNFCDSWYGYGFVEGSNGYERTDPDLVAAVETLGSKEASGSMAALTVQEIPDGIDWYIDEYDGIETIHEKHRSW